MDAYQEVKNPGRRSLLETRGLCPELRESPAAIQALDAALARATAFDPSTRPASAKLFAESILPWLDAQPRSVHVSTRWLDRVEKLDISRSKIQRDWIVRHPPGDDRVLLGAAWNADGHCLGATAQGLEYFDGVGWSSLPPSDCLRTITPCNVKQLSPTDWLVTTTGACLLEVGREGTSVIARGPDPRIDFVDIDGNVDDFAVVVGRANDRVPLLCALIGKRWLKPFEVTDAAHISAITRLSDASWLVVGRDRGSRAWAGLYEPLELRITTLPVPIARALLGCVSRPHKQVAVAVGGNGSVLCLDRQCVGAANIPEQPDLTVAALDLAGQFWTASIGRIYFAEEPLAPADCVWQDERWSVPFVSLHADMGHLLGLTVDGAVIECRAFSNSGAS